MKQFASGHAMQSAWVVDDLDAAVDAWLKVGIGPFFFVEYTPDLFEDSTYRGSPSPISMKIALALAGDMQIELIEPTGEQANIYRDTVPEGKTAFHHLCYWTDDIDGEISSLVEQGYEVAATGGGGGELERRRGTRRRGAQGTTGNRRTHLKTRRTVHDEHKHWQQHCY